MTSLFLICPLWIEKEANEFAACLLMPEKDVQQQLLGKNLDIKLVLANITDSD